jgi:hypothetical protein
LKSDFKTISQRWSTYWDDVSRAKFGSLPWRSRSQHDLAAKSCPVLNFVVWSRILQLFHRNDHHIETMCHTQHLGHYLEWNVKVTAWPCSKIVFGLLLCYLKSDITTISQRWSPYWIAVSHATFGVLPWRSRSQHDLAALLCLAHNFFIWNYFTEMITILRQCVVHNI